MYSYFKKIGILQYFSGNELNGAFPREILTWSRHFQPLKDPELARDPFESCRDQVKISREIATFGLFPLKYYNITKFFCITLVISCQGKPI